MSTHEQLMQLRIQRVSKLGAPKMSIKEMEAALEATRREIGGQARLNACCVDARLLDKERTLEQAVADAHSHAQIVVMIEDIAHEFMEERGNLTNYWKTYNLNEREQRDVRQYLDARLRERDAAYVEVAAKQAREASGTLQDLLTEYKD